MLEGRIETLLRPEAAFDRVQYVLMANLLIGTVGALFVIRRVSSAELVRLDRLGFQTSGRSLVWVIAGITLGLAFYAVQSPPTMDPVVILNGYTQVLSVSVAEVLVCWVVVGGLIERALQPIGKVLSVGVAVVAAAIVFGAYHLAHSPPFDTMGMVLLLSAVGMVTGAFFFTSRNVYGTVAFHNFLGVLGVLQALERADRLESYAVIQVPLFLMGAVAVGLLVVLHSFWLPGRRGDEVMVGGHP